MAVIEHEIHSKVIQKDNARYGCHNRDWSKARGYYADHKERRMDGTYFDSQVFIPHVMSKECRFDHSLSDPLCDGCCHQGSGEEYNLHVRMNGK